VQQPRGLDQWLRVVGKRLKDNEGCRITFTKKTASILQNITDFYNTTEGLEEISALGIEAPDHLDDVVNWIANALTSRELSRETFKFAMKSFRRNYFGIGGK
jgi:hypothetical protein